MLDVALEAIARVRERISVTLDVLGDGPMRAKWEAHSRGLMIGETVRFHGFIPQDEVAKYLARSDALVLPSVYECGGAVVLEAMAMGLPVIATAWGGPMDYLDDSTGFLVDPVSREALVAGFADAFCSLANSPAYRIQLGKRAKEVVAERFDWRRKVDRILEIYDEAIARFAALHKRKLLRIT